MDIAKKYWYGEWKRAEKAGQHEWAKVCKNKYKEIVLNNLRKEPSIYYVEASKAFPIIYLN